MFTLNLFYASISSGVLALLDERCRPLPKCDGPCLLIIQKITVTLMFFIIQLILVYQCFINIYQINLNTFKMEKQNSCSSLLSILQPSLTSGVLSFFPNEESLNRKGSCGRLAVIGGCLEYTGAPYYASITQLIAGGDLTYVVCHESAMIPIKSYSPEIIVLSLHSEKDILLGWFSRLESIVIGPGLGRDHTFFKQNIAEVILQLNQKIMIFDADSLWNLGQLDLGSFFYFFKKLNHQQNTIILTPNIRELAILVDKIILKEDEQNKCTIEELSNEINLILQEKPKKISDFQNGKLKNAMIALISVQQFDKIYVVIKFSQDIIIQRDSVLYPSAAFKSIKRCGGQGDVLCGLISVYSNWCKQRGIPIEEGIQFACELMRAAAFVASEKFLLSLTTVNVIDELRNGLIGVWKFYFQKKNNLQAE